MRARIDEMAEALFWARTELRQIPPLREAMGLATIEDAQAVQEATVRRWLAGGRRLVGRKIGLTSKAVQGQMGVSEPDYGVLWGDYGFAAGDTVDMARFMQPRAEAEVAFLMARRIDDPLAQMPELMRAIAYAVPAVEIVDSAIADWNIRLVDTVADNASGGGFALGPSPRSLDGLDLRLCGMVMSRNGETVSTGVGAACLGHPLSAMLWLVRKMAELGRPVEEGDVVLSGALGPVVPVRGGDVFTIEIAGFQPFQVGFAGTEAGK